MKIRFTFFRFFYPLSRNQGHINIDDVLDIAGVHGNDQSQKHREYMKQRDAVIIVCSKPLKECIEQRKDLEFIVKGRLVSNSIPAPFAFCRSVTHGAKKALSSRRHRFTKNEGIPGIEVG